jgi:hypothetical protein
LTGDDAAVQVISAARPEWIHPFTGLESAQFRCLVRVVARRGGDQIADGRPGRQWALDLPDRVLLVAAYWRTNLTMRQIGPLFGVSHSAAHRVIDTRLTASEVRQLGQLRPDLAVSGIVALLVDDVLAGRHQPRWAAVTDDRRGRQTAG